jgi:hypothetical protein
VEFIVGTDEYLFVEPTETTGELTQTFEALGASATYSVFPDDMLLADANAKVLNQNVNEITGNVFKCRINPDDSWDQGTYALYLKITDIPGYAEKPRFGPFRFGVVK